MAQARTIYNTKCIKCKIIESEMVLIGPIPFCTKCYINEFGDKGTVDSQNEKYKDWLKKYKKL